MRRLKNTGKNFWRGLKKGEQKGVPRVVKKGVPKVVLKVQLTKRYRMQGVF